MRPARLANLPDSLTITQVAGILRVSKLTLKRWEKKGWIKSTRICKRGDRRYRKDYIISFIQEKV